MTLPEFILTPFSLIYGAVTHLRARAYRKGILKPRRLDATVISVGNLTVGGTGKTPMVMWIVERLAREGKNVGVLTRGYRGRPSAAREETLLLPSSASSSDEVRMMQGRLCEGVTFGVGPNRYENGVELVKRGVNWIVLDDGFQHLQVARDVDIVLIDASNPFGGGRLLPAGRLREPRSALARADIVVITRSAHAPAIESAVRRETDAPIFYARAQLDSIHSFNEGRLGSNVALEAIGKLFAFCAIGNPSAFLADLREWGLQIAGHKFFPDHHRFTDADDEEILREAAAAGATGLICTEKDLYNLHAIHYAKMPIFFCAISMHIDREDEFWNEVLAKAKSRADASQLKLHMTK
ncbi:MAG: tetraacyldisaccharide 4'-kinase [Candidatus Acidiferrales bacterium]